MFAKLYNTELGQILVKKDVDEEEKSEVRFYFIPEGLGVSSMGLSFENEESAAKYFEIVTEEIATMAVEKIIERYLKE